MFEAGRYKNALNRAYYAIFYGIRAVNALDGLDFFIASKEDAEMPIERAEQFQRWIESFLHSKKILN